MEKLDIEIAGLRGKSKKYIANGIATPPPPIPATVLKAMIREKTIVPMISFGYRGHKFLCTHYYLGNT